MTHHVRSNAEGLIPDDQLAGYQIQEQIGRGGMAVVYRALDLRLGRLVALKVLASNPGADAAFRQRFIRESRAAAGLDHPHIIPVYDAGESGGTLFIAMRYCAAGDLRSLIEAEGMLSPSRAASIVGQVAAALDAAHAHGLVHRDVKPGNILLDQAGDSSDHVYLSDFGLIKHSLAPSTLTSTGQFLGTLDYVSPEQIQGRPVDGRADEYALACAAVEMLTGTPPFRRADTVALMWAQLEAEPPRLTDRRPELPAAVDDVIATALAKKPESRYPTCREFAAALSRACAPAAPSASRSAAPPESWPTALPGEWAAAVRDDEVADLADSWLSPRPLPEPPSGHPPSGHPAPARPRSARPADRRSGSRAAGRRRSPASRALLTLAIVAAITVAGAVAYRLAHRPQPGPPAAGQAGFPTAQTRPAQVVRDYFMLINRHRYREAWVVSGQHEPLASYAAGYAGTTHDTVTILGTKGNIVLARLVAHQADGSVRVYEGTYTVVGGRIARSHVLQLR